MARLPSLIGGLREGARQMRAMARYGGRGTFWRYLAAALLAAPTALAQRDLAALDRRMSGRTHSFRSCRGRTVTIDGSYFSFAREIFVKRVYSLVPGFDISDGDQVVDLGANVGTFSLLAASCGARVLAVEAQSGLIPLFVKTLDANGLGERVVIEHGLVGGGAGVFADAHTRTDASHWHDDAPELGIEQLLSKHRIEHVDLLKVDIEGSEFDLFREPAPWLDKVERITMEHHPDYGDVERLRSLLKARGFDVVLADRRLMIVDQINKDDPNGFLFAAR